MIEPSLATGEMITFKKPFEDTNLDEAGQWIQNLLGDEEWDIGLGRFQDLNELNILSKAEKINVKSFKISILKGYLQDGLKEKEFYKVSK